MEMETGVMEWKGILYGIYMDTTSRVTIPSYPAVAAQSLSQASNSVSAAIV